MRSVVGRNAEALAEDESQLLLKLRLFFGDPDSDDFKVIA